MEKQKVTRKFTGKLSEFETNKERNFSKKALKAYIRGKERFRWGFDETIKEPQYFNTPQEYKQVNE